MLDKVYMHDYVIVGGGISGLYCAYRILQKDPASRIRLIESDTELGGRIRTQMTPGFQVEKGAARFSETHHRLLSLIKAFGLESEMVKIPSHRDFVYQGHRKTFDLSRYMTDMMTQSRKVSPAMLQKITLYQWAVKLYGSAIANMIQSSFGYDSEFTTLNAYAGFQMFSKDFFSQSQYYVLACGLSTLIQRIGQMLQDKGVTLTLGTKVTDIQRGRVSVGSKVYKGHHIICAIPKNSLQSFPLFSEIPEIQHVEPIPLCRIYMKYPLTSGKPWFYKMKKTTTDNYLRYIIPINESQGTIMYYTDARYAQMWNDWSKVSESELVKRVHQALHEVFPKTKVDAPTDVKVCFWGAGVHLWKPGINFRRSSRSLVQPLGSQKVYICNEAYSELQDWMEGSLQMADSVLRKIFKTSKKTRYIRSKRSTRKSKNKRKN